MDHVVRDAAELLLAVALGGMLWSAVGRLRRGQIHVVRCGACRRPSSRAHPRCRHCGADRR